MVYIHMSRIAVLYFGYLFAKGCSYNFQVRIELHVYQACKKMSCLLYSLISDLDDDKYPPLFFNVFDGIRLNIIFSCLTFAASSKLLLKSVFSNQICTA